ncbi:hypothetical protein V6N13_024199 [Hibiscus sabdariffa]
MGSCFRFELRKWGWYIRVTFPDFLRAVVTVRVLGGMRENERYGLEGVKDEVAGMVWREDMNLARPMEVLDFEGIMMPRPVQRLTGMVEGMVEAVGAVGNVVVVEMELDSASNMDRDVNLIPNSVIVVPSNFDENLTIVPIEQTATIPLHSVVPQVIQCPSEVVVSGADGVTETSWEKKRKEIRQS